MKAVILAGGLGTRLSEETAVKPKPMVEIGGKPILWHIMKMYSVHGVNDFIICLGYRGYLIKEYFANYFLHMSDVTFDMTHNQMHVHQKNAEPWKVTLVETGESTFTGGRLKRVRNYLEDEDFCFTYGDGVSDVDITALIAFHQSHQKLATVTAVNPMRRFGVLEFQDDRVLAFQEKPDSDWVNGGFFVLSPKVIDYIHDDTTIWEQEPMKKITENGEMRAYFHKGFWQPMDTLREKILLEDLWNTQKAPWKTWL
ncbi:MAG: glucose-1-phosphate cytidylyltransferase [Gammaproteobacteria bacterium CG_4_10_14_0_8_um_filter_38_16]|nr:MAG: glucose-1-phosphate cytidylyltransferase [Gammaproteobacteria bacterium CG_4_10_14_0_8_um_filter_38_16]PJA03259.1 MAG: glucose-1-phosphate cytidylyltransferase [Gammaproteobacteria bacterium CG_4_10_14_0_2_um_filter_38_22]PJB09839.1 MAG: glucose-1-phosphate cytidylyltransferase [Gammaproteobacteria bacterium CG_4_9_14_3_um_filter_38_9]